MSLSKNDLTLVDKTKIIRSFEAGKKQIDVSKEFGILQTIVNSLWACRKGIWGMFLSNEVLGSRKQFKESKHPELESVLLLWHNAGWRHYN